MAFIAGCPKCQKPVLVPEGHGHDAVVQCPACFAEYSLGEILASVPELIVVHPGRAVAPAASAVSADVGSLGEPGLAAVPQMVGSAAAASFAEHSLHESDALDFVEESPSVAAGNGHDIAFAAEGDHAADALFAAAFAEEAPPSDHGGESGIEALSEPLLAPVDGEGEPAANAGENGDGWGGNWGGFGEDTAHGETAHAAVADDTVDVAAHEEGEDGGMAHLDFAAITGKSPPGTAAAGDAAAEPQKKKRPKRKKNIFTLMLGMALSGALAVACVLLIAEWRGVKLDFLPDWLQFFHHSNQTAANKPNNQPAPNKAQMPAVNANAPAANTNTPSATTNTPPVSANTPPSSASPSGADAGKPGPSGTLAGAKPGDAAKAATPSSPSPSAAANPGNAVAGGSQPRTKPRMPASDEGATPTDPIAPGPETEDQGPPSQPGKNDLGAPAAVAPVGEKPKAEAPSKAQTPAAPAAPNKPADGDPFAGPADTAVKPQAVAPKIEKPKTETSPPIKSVPPVKETPVKPDTKDPFSNPPEIEAKPQATPKIEKPKAEPKTEPKPVSPPEIKPEPPAKSETPTKPETPGKPGTYDPFSNPQDVEAKPPAAAPKSEMPKAEPKPELPAPAKPETPPAIEPPVEPVPSKPEPAKPEPAKPEPAPPELPKPELAKPEAAKPETPKPEAIKPETAKPEVPKPEPVKPQPVKPDPKPAVKVAAIGPTGAPAIPAVQLDSALGRVAAAAQPAYGDLCQLAETATYVQGATPAQKQALRDAVKKLAGNPQAVARLAADAKKLMDDKATKGGIALCGKVSKVASKNGLFGTAIRIDGLANAVMVFSSHPLDVKEGDPVLVLGALVSEPAKNLPGYTGKLPVVVWADMAQATP